MKCSTIMYKISRSKLLKKLAKELDNPDNYVAIYQQLVDLFSGYKSKKYNEDTIKKMLDLYLEKKGLNKINDVLEEIEMKQNISRDNYVVLELRQDMSELNRKMTELQELMIKKLEENKSVHNKLLKVKNNHRRIRHPKD